MTHNQEPSSHDLRLEVLDKINSLLTAAFGLVAALAWNSAVQELFTTYFAAGAGIAAKVGYATVVTVIAVAVVVYLGKALGHAKAAVGALPGAIRP